MVNIPNDEHVGDSEKAVSTPGVRALVRGIRYEISGEIDRADRSVGIMADAFYPTGARPVDARAPEFPWESLTDAEILEIDRAFWAAQPPEPCDPIDEEQELDQGKSR